MRYKCFVTSTTKSAIDIIPICQNDFTAWAKTQSQRIQNLTTSSEFSAQPNTFCLLPNSEGNLERVLLGIKSQDDFLAFGILSKVLPAGCYSINAPNFSLPQLERAAIGWGMGSYRFKRYKDIKDTAATLLCDKINVNKLEAIISAVFLVRDLINTPASDLYPEKLASVAMDLANEFKATVKVTTGDELIRNFPAVYAVGRGSEKKPVLIDLQYGDSNAPKIVLIGKGVCFDSGGLQIKTSTGMALMKKDMAGAAHALALARLIMSANLPINLRVIIPAVENLVSGDALKPGDIIKTRKGLSIEVINTDAEGRLILSDALALASEWQPKLIIDFATLTYAARVALGPDIVALFANDDDVAKSIMKNMAEEQEQVWRMPLFQPYFEFLKSEIADLKNIATSEHAGAGAILAALVLQQFVGPNISWVHLDMNAYNAITKPGRPEGGEASCLIGIYRYLEQNFR